MPLLKRELSTMANVDRVVEGAEFTNLGYPDPHKQQRMADLVLSAKTGYSFGGAFEGPASSPAPEGSTLGAHGYLNTDPDMDGILILSGAGIKPGVRLGRARTVDTAPTIARLLGLDLGKVDGKVIY